jgi:predicted short-subunit dehydrogenase-like oxidoreductase (DUF2520 family)
MGALRAVGGYEVLGALGRGDDLSGAASGADLVVIATPDSAVPATAAAIAPGGSTVVIHLSGSLGLDVLACHPRRGGLHPLVPLPDPETGAARLRSGVGFAVAGDPLVRSMALALGGQVVEVDDRSRAAYHAAATIAANHVGALMGQVERVAAQAGLPLHAFSGLVEAAMEDAMALGPQRALTGPAARGDWETIARHRAVLSAMANGPAELDAYDTMVGLARRLVDDHDTMVGDHDTMVGTPAPVVVTRRTVWDAA